MNVTYQHKISKETLANARIDKDAIIKTGKHIIAQEFGIGVANEVGFSDETDKDGNVLIKLSAVIFAKEDWSEFSNSVASVFSDIKTSEYERLSQIKNHLIKLTSKK